MKQRVEIDMEEWCQSWVRTAGLNSIEANLGTMEIKQSHTIPGFETLRTHKIKVGGFGREGLVEVIDV